MFHSHTGSYIMLAMHIFMLAIHIFMLAIHIFMLVIHIYMGFSYSYGSNIAGGQFVKQLLPIVAKAFYKLGEVHYLSFIYGMEDEGA